MNEDIIKFGGERVEHICRVYSARDGVKLGWIKRQMDKPKWIFFPSMDFKHKLQYCVLDTDLESSQQIVHKMIMEAIGL